jgi:hypothetical protein
MTELFNIKKVLLFSFFVFICIYLLETYLSFDKLNGVNNVLFVYNLITAIVYFLLLALVVNKKRYTKYDLIFITFMVTSVLIFVNDYIFLKWGHTQLFFGAVDAVTYNHAASNISHLNFGGRMNFLNSTHDFGDIGDKGFPIFLSYVYTIFDSPNLMDCIDLILSLGTVFLLYKIGKTFLPKKYAYTGALIYGISQYAIFFSSSGLKEPLMVFIIVLSFFFYIQYVKEKGVMFLTLAIFTAFLVAFFRLPLMIFLVVSFALNELTGKKMTATKYILIGFLAIASIALYSFFSASLLETYVDSAGNNAFVTVSATGALHYNTFGYIVSFFSGLFGPFPTYMPFDHKRIIAMYAASITLKVFLSIYFFYAVYYAFKLKNNFMKPLILFALFDIAGLIYEADTLQVRKSMPHLPFVIMVSMYTIANYKQIIRGVHKYIFAGYYIGISGVLLMWNYMRL